MEESGEQGEALTAEEEQELKGMPETKNAPSQHFSKKSSGKRGPSRAAPVPKLGQGQEGASADSADQFDTKSVKGQQNVVQKGSKKQVKKLQKKSQKKEEEAANESSANTAESNVESQSNEQIEQLNKHLGAIEGKVSEITKKYEELKKADENKDKTIQKLSETRAQMSSSSSTKEKSEAKVDLKTVDKSKI